MRLKIGAGVVEMLVQKEVPGWRRTAWKVAGSWGRSEVGSTQPPSDARLPWATLARRSVSVPSG